MYSSLLIIHTVVVAVMMGGGTATPLDDYVNTPDPHYGYRLLTKYYVPGVTVYIFNMTSQKWLTEEVTKTPVWWHYLTITVPDKIEYTDTGFFWIDQGSNYNEIPKMTDQFVALMAVLSESTGTVAATVKQIPNQPLEFLKDPQHKHRSEDAIIAWTWREFIENGSNPEILLRLPMTKAAVRGMDSVASFMKNTSGQVIDKFVIGGVSKRGWTTWTTAAVDKRVIGMIPIVMDLLNTQKNLHHHYRSLGGWTFAFNDYYDENITRDLDHPNMERLRAVVDPLSYNERYTMPKFVVSGTGDEFFLPDDSHYYYSELKSPKYLRIVPNSDHYQEGHIISDMFAMRSFYLNILEKAEFPTLTWEMAQNATAGKISVKTSRKPVTALVYHATTLDDKRRDFRLFIEDPSGSGKPYPHPVIWFSKNAETISDLEYKAVVEMPKTGWSAFFIQFTFEGAKNTTLEFTTEANIVPDKFPFPDCSGASCYGSLV